jgi:hypothetical protein
MTTHESPREEESEVAAAPRVRHFTLTSGRTSANVDLPLEATLQVLDDDASSWQPGHLARVLDVCDNRSVAEVSALTHLPIGVTRVLLGDLVDQGIVRVRTTITDASSKDERRDLIERTLRGLRAL